MADLKGRDLKGIADFTREEIEQHPGGVEGSQAGAEDRPGPPPAGGQEPGGIFETPSTRTCISFETAMTQLGGHMIYLDEHRLWVGRPPRRRTGRTRS